MPDGSRLYVANAISDAIAVMDTTEADGEGGEGGNGRADRLCADGVDADVDGYVSNDGGGKLYVATAKGKGTGPNNFPQKP